MLYFLKFGEIFLKSNSTKKRFITYLKQNLKQKGIDNIDLKHSYALVKTDKNISLLQNTFGVHKIEAIKYDIPLTEKLEQIYYIFDDIVKNYDFQSFAIRAKRENKQYFIDSMEIQRQIGKYISQKHDKTPMYKNPDISIYIRILKDRIWVWTSYDVYDGIAGLPYGSEGKALNLFSGGIDSPVATFLAAKRGIKQDFLFLNIAGSEFLLSQVFAIYKFLKTKYGIDGTFFSLNIQDIIKKIKEEVPAGYRQIIFKIFLYKLGEKFADKLGVEALVSGENIGQVSTQTLKNMELLNTFSSKLHIRPLVCFDKIEIMEFARKIGTFDLSGKIKETCNIETHSNARINNKKYVEELFDKLNIDINELVGKIVEVSEVLDLNSIEKYKTNEVIGELIDIEKIKKIPKLEKGKKYTFSCSSGYKASSFVLRTRKEGYDTYFLQK